MNPTGRGEGRSLHGNGKKAEGKQADEYAGLVAARSPETEQIGNFGPCPEEWEVFHMMP